MNNTLLRGLLWVLFVLGVAGNAVSSLAGLSLAINLPCGIVALLVGAALITMYVRRRRS
ncbi:hypothetical protein [Nonomuraea sp. NEAU-A123]|uniref:hypothetical protein n=1 Tax=Nonomuraea sp. NEAU-A123 TaxID=2839649 RepID=UPI001BE43FEA|nr:hypothetical protein [Nonomuraea sp. NEAU-A123]MBT2226721.1 hypothetical protein [Nonomuraea sp. NEAU-A123]